jgi:hypothetical protein
MSNSPRPESTAALRDELAQLKARYDDHFPPAIFAVVRRVEMDVAWQEHAARGDIPIRE